MQTNNTELALMTGFTLAMVLLAMPLVFAEENATTMLISTNNQSLEISNQTLDNETMQEINDDLNESVSDFDMGMAKLGLWFTFNQEKKAEKELKLARLELIRARVFAKNNNTVAMENALEAHDRLLEKIQTRINSLQEDSTKEGTKKSVDKLIGLERAIAVHEARIQKLKDLIASDSNLTEEQIANIQEKLSKAENNTEHLKDVQEAKKEKIKTKLMAIGNMSEDEAESEIHDLEDTQNLSEVKQVIAEKRFSEFEEHLEEVNQKISELKAEGKNTTALEKRIGELEKIAEEARALIQDGKYDDAISKLKQFSESKKESEKEMREQAREQTKKANEISKEQGKKLKELDKKKLGENNSLSNQSLEDEEN